MRLSEVTGKKPDPRNFVKSPVYPNITGLIGVELEFEPTKDIKTNNLKYWEFVPDGSLRGNYPVEMVLAHPCTGGDLVEAIGEAHTHVSSCDVNFLEGGRTSVHVHMDTRDMSVESLLSLLTLYCMVEKVLFRYVGQDRYNSIYCVPWCETDTMLLCCGSIYALLTKGKDKVSTPGYIGRALNSTHKYSALNLLPIVFRGSIEFRHHPGEYRADKLLKWIDILSCLKTYAENTPQCESHIGKMSTIGSENMLKEIFGTYYSELTYPGAAADMLEGARLAQEIVLSIGENSAKKFPAFDPFRADNLQCSTVYKYITNTMNLAKSVQGELFSNMGFDAGANPKYTVSPHTLDDLQSSLSNPST
jgi:hypothetical protein